MLLLQLSNPWYRVPICTMYPRQRWSPQQDVEKTWPLILQISHSLRENWPLLEIFYSKTHLLLIEAAICSTSERKCSHRTLRCLTLNDGSGMQWEIVRLFLPYAVVKRCPPKWQNTSALLSTEEVLNQRSLYLVSLWAQIKRLKVSTKASIKPIKISWTTWFTYHSRLPIILIAPITEFLASGESITRTPRQWAQSLCLPVSGFFFTRLGEFRKSDLLSGFHFVRWSRLVVFLLATFDCRGLLKICHTFRVPWLMVITTVFCTETVDCWHLRICHTFRVS